MDHNEVIAPYESDRPHVTRNRTSWQAWLLIIFIVGVLVTLSIPLTSGGRRDPDRTKAVGHAKQVWIAYVEFEAEYGAPPGQWVVDGAKVPGAKAETANDCFRQFLQGLQTVRSEAVFFAPSRISKQPDNDIGDESNHFAEACEKGESGFLYVDSPTAKEGAPILAAPLFDMSGRFDEDAYNGKAVVLKTDGSVESLDIDPDSERVYINVDGKKVDMLSAENPQFVDPPVIKYPDPR